MSLSFSEEQAHLAQTIQFLEQALQKIEASRMQTKNKIIAQRKNMNEHESWMANAEASNAVDNAQDLTSLRIQESTYNQQDQQLKIYQQLLNRPYFGKIILEDETLYIGTQTVTDENYNVLICDWRAPVASLFYENTLGRLSYETEYGQTIYENVLGRRQFKIEKGELINYADSDMFIGDTDLINYQMQTATHKLGNIVSTIQKDQNEIIRLPLHEDVVVLGPPGSGKTAIAMQRVAYLLFKYKTTVTHENLMLMTPNRLFNDYVSDVLPELGEQNIKVNSLLSIVRKIPYLKRIVTESKPQMLKRVYNNDTEAKQFYTKSSTDFYRFLSQQLALPECVIHFKNIVDSDGRTVLSRHELTTAFQKYRANHDLPTAIQKLKYELNDHYQTAFEELYKQNYAELEKIDTYVGEKDELMAVAQSKTDRTLKPVKKAIKFNHFLDIPNLYKQLCNQYPVEVDLTQHVLNYEDFWVQAWLYFYLTKYMNHDIKHILIDEVQDYSIFQLESIRLIYPKAHFTYLGDLNQNFLPTPLIDFRAWETPIKQLHTSYRSTKAINRYLDTLKQTDTKVVGEEGAPVVTMSDATVQDLQTIMEKVQHPTAIVVPSETIGKSLYTELATHIDIRLVEANDTFITKGHVIIPYDLVKGFEYHTVISWQHNLYQNSNIQYIIASRAIAQLYLMVSRET
ncbi:hypothetical protein TP70_02100 [Staphylococcus microti]|uniref:Helicase IV n=1 Tax=Staphylococcus microti TaxID=569857 RepID=A0A0D6XTE0_9STAP|nr:UvrD-helicase domain-containing protein [Staphylococcus microti]KIX91486.1 hypothetical protein TP70_02100 [Staphylococcus microti]PNZ77541.1 hypothetical protein CD132_10485 [Staphylococcus microti]SUM56431.1 Helicase IV [Staphylococcus microti]